MRSFVPSLVSTPPLSTTDLPFGAQSETPQSQRAMRRRRPRPSFRTSEIPPRSGEKASHFPSRESAGPDASPFASRRRPFPLASETYIGPSPNQVVV